jgi:glycosyltransferase involved in cell wall biosynthesis
MRIGYFTFTNIRIAETFILDLIKGLEKKCELFWYSGEKSIEEKIADRQIALAYSPYRSKISRILYKIGQLKENNGYFWRMRWYLFLAGLKLKRLKEEDMPDVAYAEFLTTAILLREFLEKNSIPYIVHVHAYDITSELNDPAYKREIKKVFASASYIISPSDYIKKLLILEGAPPQKIKMVRLGIDSEGIVPMDWEKRLAFGPSVLFLGRLVEKKGLIPLIYAFDIVKKRIPEAKLTIIGDGNLRKRIERLIERLGLEDSVILKGALKREESFPIMNRHWVYAQHSITTKSGDKEGAPVSISEASAHALPIVSTMHSGIPEQVIDGKTGFLVQECDYEAMAERIIYLLENPEIAAKMGRAARAHIESNNRLKERVEKIYALLENIYTYEGKS